jgi:hypothetical protein
MPHPVAPLYLGRSMYCCSPQGLHVPLETLTVEQMRSAKCYLK